MKNNSLVQSALVHFEKKDIIYDTLANEIVYVIHHLLFS